MTQESPFRALDCGCGVDDSVLTSKAMSAVSALLNSAATAETAGLCLRNYAQIMMIVSFQLAHEFSEGDDMETITAAAKDWMSKSLDNIFTKIQLISVENIHPAHPVTQ